MVMLTAEQEALIKSMHNETSHAPAAPLRAMIPDDLKPEVSLNEIKNVTDECVNCLENKDNRHRAVSSSTHHKDHDMVGVDLLLISPP